MAEECFVQDYLHQDENFWKECLRNLARTKAFSDNEAVLFTVAYSILCGIGLVSNGLLIFVLFSDVKQIKPSDVFIVNLALSSFLLAALYIPFLWLPVNHGDFTYGLFFCKFANALPGSNVYCSTMTIAVMAVDRYYIVVNIHRKSAPGNRHCISVIVACAIWLIAFALSLPYLLYYDLHVVRFPLEYAQRFNKTEEIILFTTCTLRPPSCVVPNLSPDKEKDCIRHVELVVSILQAVFLYVIPLIVLIVYCLKLTHFLHKNEQRRQQRLMPIKDYSVVSEAPDGSGPKGTPMSKSQKRNTRAIKLLFVMATSYAFVWMPFQALSLYISLRPTEWQEETVAIIMRIDEAFKLISMLSICINPIIYGFMNRNVCKRFKMLLANSHLVCSS